ncbi:unnamed protein product [Lactuca saligna]|uniref:Uncharacterized protein n=1 Tax=Lactuca saligna TaxID=75948 RepID=A0AA35YQD3_LACSI|nr:unnamed protein product [Lactuca saligna]
MCVSFVHVVISIHDVVWVYLGRKFKKSHHHRREVVATSYHREPSSTTTARGSSRWCSTIDGKKGDWDGSAGDGEQRCFPVNFGDGVVDFDGCFPFALIILSMLLPSSSRLPPYPSYRCSFLPCSLAIFSLSLHRFHILPSRVLCLKISLEVDPKAHPCQSDIETSVERQSHRRRESHTARQWKKMMMFVVAVCCPPSLSLTISALSLFFSSMTVSSSFIFSIFHQVIIRSIYAFEKAQKLDPTSKLSIFNGLKGGHSLPGPFRVLPLARGLQDKESGFYKLLQNKTKTFARADVARALQVMEEKYLNAFDLASKHEGSGTLTKCFTCQHYALRRFVSSKQGMLVYFIDGRGKIEVLSQLLSE